MDPLHVEIGHAIEGQREALARAVVSCQYLHAPDLWHRYDERGRKRCTRVANDHLRQLAQSIAVSCPALFQDYMAWSRVNLSSRGVPEKDLRGKLICTQEVLRNALPGHMHAPVERYLTAGIQCLTEGEPIAGFLDSAHPLAAIGRAYLDLLLKRNRKGARSLILDTLDNGATVSDVYRHIFSPTQQEIGRLWQTNQLSIAEEHYATAVTQFIMAELYPHIIESDRNGHTVLGACLGGDLHEIGLRMVLDFLEMDGWDSHYLGGNLPSNEITQAAQTYEADLLALSITMTYHLDALNRLIQDLRSTPATQSLPILVGGHPFNVDPSLWQVVGADGYARDAEHAIETAHALVATPSSS